MAINNHPTQSYCVLCQNAASGDDERRLGSHEFDHDLHVHHDGDGDGDDDVDHDGTEKNFVGEEVSGFVVDG